MSSLLYSPNFKSSEAELRRNHTEFMDSNIFQQQRPQPQQQQGSGLMRYRSAPSSFLMDLVDNNGGGSEDFRDFRYLRPSSPEEETVLAGFISSCNEPDHDDNGGSNILQQQHQFEERSVKQEVDNSVSNQNAYLNSSHQMRSSSPAGFFPSITVENGFNVMKEAASFRASNGTNGESSPLTSRLNNQFNYPSGSPSYSRSMPQITENGNGNMGDQGSRPDQSLENVNGRNSHYISNFPNDSWDISEFSDLKRGRDNDGSKFSTSTALETQNTDFGHQNHSLTHHLSLPTHFEMPAMEKFLQFQDSIPCKIRAKRGFATHPRSIAERMRRTRISDRMKKLQDLFPNMDKQINTADMLELSVEYIKDLQKEVKTLKETKAKCVCSSNQK